MFAADERSDTCPMQGLEATFGATFTHDAPCLYRHGNTF